MKKINFTYWSHKKQAFWSVWGLKKFILCSLVFLLLLYALLSVMSLSGSEGQSDNDDVAQYTDTIPTGFPGQVTDPGFTLPDSTNNRYIPIDDDAFIKDDDSGQLVANNLLNVILDSEADDSTFKRFADEFKGLYPGAEYYIEFYDTHTKMLRIRVPESQREYIRDNLPSMIPDISFYIFDETAFEAIGYIPNDPGFSSKSKSWYFAPIQAYDAWSITKGSKDIKIAIVDSYFDLYQSEFANTKIENPYSVRFQNSNVAPAFDCPRNSAEFYHGTGVASVALGNMNNDIANCGIAPECTLIPVSMGHKFTTFTIMEGVLYAIYNGANVVNISAGTHFDEEMTANMSLEEQIQYSQYFKKAEAIWDYIFNLAEARNVTIVWSAGNESIFSLMDDSKRGTNTIRVAALNEKLEPAWFTNFGNIPQYGFNESTISAPGTEIYVAHPKNSFEFSDGTSFSAPIVTGAVALMKSIDPTLTNEEIIDILQQTGKIQSQYPQIGPVLQIYDALLMVKGQFANMNDVLKNHGLIIGKWRSTQMFDVIREKVKVDECWLYFEFDTEYSGRILFYEAINSKATFIAPVEIKWRNDSFDIIQTDNASCPAYPDLFYSPYNNYCVPNSDGLISCKTHNNSGDELLYLLKKIK